LCSQQALVYEYWCASIELVLRETNENSILLIENKNKVSKLLHCELWQGACGILPIAA
jgi:hypothetical protein